MRAADLSTILCDGPGRVAEGFILVPSASGLYRRQVRIGRGRRLSSYPWAAAFSSSVVGSIDFPSRATFRRIQASGMGRNQ
jgi:hypothetical protein